MKIHVYQDLRGEWRWRLVAPNGRVMADSAEGYVEHRGVLDAIDTVINGITSGAVKVVAD